jgi:hypothetical protein
MGLLPLQADIVEFVEAGALGFILKNATVKEFLSTIQSVVQGEKVLPPSFTGSLFFHIAEIVLKRINPNIIPLGDCLPFQSLVYFGNNMGIVRALSWNQIEGQLKQRSGKAMHHWGKMTDRSKIIG